MAVEKRKLTCLFFSQIIGYKSLMNVNEEDALNLLDRARHFQKPIIESSGGDIIKEVGDGIMAVFKDPLQAVKGAIELQSKVFGDEEIKLSILIHQGNVIFKGSDIYGDSVDLVSNLKLDSGSGSIVLTEPVHEVLKDNKDLNLIFLGEKKVRGKKNPIKIYAVKGEKLTLPDTDDEQVEYLPKHNLPPDRVVFIGRKREIGIIKELAVKNQMITLTGTNGIGKSSLALMASKESLDNFSDGVWRVELYDKKYEYDIIKSIANVLRIREKGEVDLIEQILDYIKDRQLLLFLDNCDLLLETCADLVSRMVQKAPRVTLILTSRDYLNLPGEIIWKVPSLPYPEESTHESGLLENFESVSLLLDRIDLSGQKSDVNAYDLVNIGRMCRYVEGIPLAIELVAAVIEDKDLNALSLGLKEKVYTDQKKIKSADKRASIIRNTLEWAYQLLDEQQKKLFYRLSIFSAKFDKNSVASICNLSPVKEDQITSLLEELRSRALISLVQDQSEIDHFEMHPVIKVFGREKLKKSKEETELSRKYFSYFNKTVEKAFREQITDPVKWIEWLKLNHQNINRIFELEDIEDNQKLLIATHLGWFYCHQLYLSEGIYRINQFMEVKPKSQEVRARALQYLGYLYGLHGEMIEAGRRLYESVRLWKKTNPSWEYVMAMMQAGVMTCYTDVKSGLKLLLECSSEAENLDIPVLKIMVRKNVAFAYLENQQPFKAEPLLEDIKSVAQKNGQIKDLLDINFYLATCSLLSENYEKARNQFMELIRDNLKLNKNDQIIMAMQGLAMSYVGLKDFRMGFHIFGASQSRQIEFGMLEEDSHFWKHCLTTILEPARSRFGEKKASELSNLGRDAGFRKTLKLILK